jgi:hypothetical protein
MEPEDQILRAAGFEAERRGGKIIWKRPDTGFYVSQENALHFLRHGLIKKGRGA